MDMIRYIWMMVFLLLPSAILFAQEVIDGRAQAVVGIPNAGHYIVAIIAGFVLAVAFQLILTNLSVAAGLEVASTVTKPEKARKSPGPKTSPDEGNTIGENVRMISSAFGVWTLITATIALFFASWLAAELSLTASATVGAVIGLVIWGMFYIAMMTIEVNALSSLVGSLIKLASSGLKTAYEATASMFVKSDQAKIEDTAARVANAVKEEMFGTTDSTDIKHLIKDYIKELKPREFDPKEFAAGFSEMLNNTEIRAIVQDNFSMDTETVYAQLRSRGMEEKGARKLASKSKNIFSMIKEEQSKNKPLADKIIDGSMKAAGMPESEVKETRRKFEDYLRRSGREELDPDAIKADLERLFSDPSGAARSLKERLQHIDRETISSAISANSDMSKEEIDRRTDQVYSVIENLRTGVTEFKDSIISKMKDYMDSLDNPELRYDEVADDVQRLFHDPKAGAESLMHRIKSIDRETLKHMLSYRKDISEEDAERIISRIEMARDNVKNKIEQMQVEIKRRIEDAKVEAVHQANEVRKTAATAAWWAFATAIISGVGAVMGGIIASTTF
jgi:ElaB/YqjD/DUF883 family membrane-anchored ribosome-binding protein